MSANYFSAIDGFIASATMNRTPEDTPVQQDFQTPFRFFEHLPRDVEPGLMQWLILDVPSREDAVRKKIRLAPKQEAEGTDEYALRAHRLKRDLLFIIQEEARSPKGVRSVAAIAFNGLFPEAPKEK
jgi:hypothetical protein